MEKKRDLGLQHDVEGEKMIAQQLSESYQSGVIDYYVEEDKQKRKRERERERK